MTFSLRVATAEDYPVFARLFPELAVQDPLLTLEQFATQMLPNVVILEQAGEPVGYTFWQVYGSRARVSHVVVDPRARGRGAGRALMEEVRRRVLVAGCTLWSLNVKQENVAAIRLYKRCGFAIEQEGWEVRAEWSKLVSIQGPPGDVTAYAPGVAEDDAIAMRFDESPERIAMLRGRAGVVSLAMSEAGTPVAFAGFDPAVPRVYPIYVERVELVRPLFDGFRPHARESQVKVLVEGNRALFEALQTSGAQIEQERYRMGGGALA
jgi:GNAT superfamily N-acetyltransferase